MKTTLKSTILVLTGLLVLLQTMALGVTPPGGLYPKLQTYLDQVAKEFDQIPAARKAELDKLAQFVATKQKAKKEALTVFICFHNSRRSIMAEVMSEAASRYYGVTKFKSFSGGVEVTAFNKMAQDALGRAGCSMLSLGTGENPRIRVNTGSAGSEIVCYSKKYDDEKSLNPKKEFSAVILCTEAEKACPTVNGAEVRIALPLEDPRKFDDQPDAKAKYDETLRTIAREMMYVMQGAKQLAAK